MGKGNSTNHSHDGEHSHSHDGKKHDSHGHDHHGDSHGHSHGYVDPSILTTERGIWAVKWSFIGLFITALFQIIVFFYTGSVALLADTIHNLGDAATALPLWAAFVLARRQPTRRFTYGLGRIEDLAGVFVVLMILLSALVAGYESIKRFYAPQEISYLWAVVVASIIGFIGNEAVAFFRIKVGKEIGSAALVADGYHARTDGLTSLAVLFGAIGVYFGFPLTDPIVGLIISVMILKIVWDSAKVVFTRLIDGVDPEIVDEIERTVRAIPQVEEVTEVRVRWNGHKLLAEINLAVEPEISVAEGHQIAVEVERQLLEKVKYLAQATIHLDPKNLSGEKHHRRESEAEAAHSH
jgi:cation diffusion facilitator family transporter